MNWQTRSWKTLLLSYHGQLKPPLDLAAKWQLPRNLPSGQDPLEWAHVSLGISVGAISEFFADLVGVGTFSNVDFVPSSLCEALDQGSPILCTARGIKHDFLIVGYRTVESLVDPVFYVHDPTGDLTETKLGLNGMIAVPVKYSVLKEQFEKPISKPFWTNDALTYNSDKKSPRSLSIYLSELEAEDRRTGTQYESSADFACDHTCGEECWCPGYRAYFDRGLRWEMPAIGDISESSVLRVGCANWAAHLYAVVANSGRTTKEVKVAVNIRSADSIGEDPLNRTFARLEVTPRTEQRVFLGEICTRDLKENLIPGKQYIFFIVLRDAETGENLDWTRFRMVVEP